MSHRQYIVQECLDQKKKEGHLSVAWIKRRFNLPYAESQAIFNEAELMHIKEGLVNET